MKDDRLDIVLILGVLETELKFVEVAFFLENVLLDAGYQDTVISFFQKALENCQQMHYITL